MKTAVDTKTEKPDILSAKTEKPISKESKTRKPKNPKSPLVSKRTNIDIACVASVSVRLSARSRHFSLFWPRKNWGGRKKVRTFLRSPQFSRG